MFKFVLIWRLCVNSLRIVLFWLILGNVPSPIKNLLSLFLRNIFIGLTPKNKVSFPQEDFFFNFPCQNIFDEQNLHFAFEISN
jgi:hypothetical protein